MDQMNAGEMLLVQVSPPAVLHAALAENDADPPSITEVLGGDTVTVTVTGLMLNTTFAEELTAFPVLVTVTWHAVD